MSKPLRCERKIVDDCFKCGMYYMSHSPHYDKRYKREVITIGCCYGHGGEYDAETREKID